MWADKKNDNLRIMEKCQTIIFANLKLESC